MEQSNPELLPTDEAAGYVHHSPRTLIRWRVERTGPPYVKLGRKVFYRRKSLDEWLAGRERQPLRECA